MQNTPSNFFKREGSLLFGQVREDSAVDVFLLQQIDHPERSLVVASGGCTAFTLLARTDCKVHATDVSVAQIALVQLKSEIFKRCGFLAGRQACCEDATAIYSSLRSNLSVETTAILDPYQDAMQFGLNNIGAVDRKMRIMREIFFHAVHSRASTSRFLEESDPLKQQEFYEQSWNTWRWKLSTSIAFSKFFLALAHGSKAAELVPPGFTNVMRDRLTRALTKAPNASNPYLWQAFFGTYPGSEEGLPLYLQELSSKRLAANWPNLTVSCADAVSWLRTQKNESLDYLGLSNILELLPQKYAQEILPEIIRTTKSGALICVRSIFPRNNLTFSELPAQLVHDPALSAEAEELDRSLFCNFYEVYKRETN